MNARAWVLGSAALGIGSIGVAYLVAAGFMFSNYGITLDSVNEASMVRSSYGGMFLGFALLFGLGALSPRYAGSGLLALLAFMGGFAAGRLVSIVVDGVPGLLVLALLAVEILYAAAAGYLLVSARGDVSAGDA